MEDLIKKLKNEGVLRSPSIEKALQMVDRADFVLTEYRSEAHTDTPLPIMAGQTISQPYTVVFMLELLSAKQGEQILDVGCGSGWTTALLSEIAGQRGNVWGVELVPELVVFGEENIAKYAYPQTHIRQANKGKLGIPEEAPFDRILVSAEAKEVPQVLVSQLRVGGVMVIPVGSAIVKVTKTAEDKVKEERHEGFIFVPLF